MFAALLETAWTGEIAIGRLRSIDALLRELLRLMDRQKNHPTHPAGVPFLMGHHNA
jgi:hypothetical protein